MYSFLEANYLCKQLFDCSVLYYISTWSINWNSVSTIEKLRGLFPKCFTNVAFMLWAPRNPREQN